MCKAYSHILTLVLLGIKDINLAKIDVEEKKLVGHSFSSA
jgi:hypothetical protein